MGLSSLRSLLPHAARRAGITRDLAITEALRACQRELIRIFGPEYSKFAEPLAVRQDGALVIACRSPAVAQTIRLHEMDVLRAVQERARRVSVSRLCLVPRSASDLREPTP